MRLLSQPCLLGRLCCLGLAASSSFYLQPLLSCLGTACPSLAHLMAVSCSRPGKMI